MFHFAAELTGPIFRENLLESAAWSVGKMSCFWCFLINRPVRMNMSLADNMAMAGKRFPVLAKYKVNAMFP
jgi:xanthine dehydrogenase molybdopterin-binding subunit B